MKTFEANADHISMQTIIQQGLGKKAEIIEMRSEIAKRHKGRKIRFYVFIHHESIDIF